MRGPSDDAIEAQEDPSATARAAPESQRQSPPGGKPLLRLLHMVESAGYTETANASVGLALAEEQQAEFRERAARFTVAPGGQVASSPAPRRGRRSAGVEAAADAAGAAAEAIGRAYVEASQRLGPASPTGPQWRSLGPWTIPNGQTYGSNRVNVAGRVSAVAVDPGNPAHVLAGAANGGVWESHNRGASWSPRTDFAATLAVGALEFDPRMPATVYCGTGEGDWWSFLGAGMLRSSDGGASWSTLCTTPFVGQGFHDIVVDPADGTHLLAGTTGGLYVSTDGGINWTRRRAARTWALAMAPAGGASAEILGASSDGLWQSTNGGTTWAAVALPGAPASFNRLAVVIAPSNPTVAYAWGAGAPFVPDPRLFGSPLVPTAYLWRRAGGNWTLAASGAAGNGTPPGVFTNQAWYDWFLAVAPDRDTQVYCGAIEVHRGDLSGAAWTWRNITNKGASGDSIHPDQHVLAFEPGQPDTIYVGNDGGLYRSGDRGVTWQHCNNGLVISEFEYLAQDYGSSRWLIGGTQDNGSQRWTGSQVWDHAADGDGGDCGVNRTTPQTVFHTFFGMSPERSTTAGNFGSWTRIAPPLPMGEGSAFYPPFECSAQGGDTIAIGGDALYVSRNNGSAWTRLALPAGARSSALYIPNVDTVFVGVADGRLFRAQWSGASWSAPTPLTTPRANAFVSDLFVDSANLSRMWATHRTVGGGRVFVSTDGGVNWIDRSAGLPALPINAIAVDPANRNRIWVAADLGVYQSLDGGLSWADFSNALPNAFVGDLVFHPHARVLRAGTRNRGVWEIPVDGWMTQPVCGVQWTGSLAGNQSRRWFTFNWPATWHMVWTVMPTTPRPGGPQISWTVQVERANAEYATYWITVRNLTPNPVSFEGRYCILSRY